MSSAEIETGPGFGDVFSWIWRRRVPIYIGVFAGLCVAGAYYLIAVPKYEAEITVMPVDDSESEGRLGGLIGQLGGVSSLLGLGLGSESAARRNLAVFKSRVFAEQFIQAKSLMPLLFEKRWDANAKTWKNDGKDPPTLTEGVRKLEKLRTISEDRRAGLVTVSIDWRDPATASRLANDMFSFANQMLRQQAIDESEATIRYLDLQIAQTQAVGVREALSRVLEGQMKTETLARTRSDFAFRIIDPARPPLRRERVSPRLLPTGFTGLIGGALLGLFVSLMMPRYRRRTL